MTKLHRWRVLGGISASVLVVVLAAILLALRDRGSSVSAEDAELDEIGLPALARFPALPNDAPKPKENPALAAAPAFDGALAPDLVIDNPECAIREGFGAAEGVASVVVPTPTGARFSVLDGNGAFFGDDLPFNPNHHRVGRRADGTVVAAFADLRLNQKGDRGPETLEPMRVYLDGALIYEHEKVWHFGVADDGSSFYGIEPLAGDASRLIIHNLDLRRESHFDLGQLYTPWDRYDQPYGSSFARDRASVMFEPAHADASGLGTHWFFPVDGGEHWSIDPRISEKDPPERASEAIFASGTVAFVTYNDKDTDGGQPFKRVVKRVYEPTVHHGEIKTPWSRTLDLDGMGRLRLSENGKWLAVGKTHLHVLNTENGETVFAFPTTASLGRHLSSKDRRQVVVRPDGRRRTWEGHLKDLAALSRLTSILGPDASPSDVGGVSHITFRGDRLLMHRTTGTGSPNKRRYYDVFDLNGIQIDSPPTFRIELNRSYGCHAGDFYTQGLQIHDGELTYLTTAL